MTQRQAPSTGSGYEPFPDGTYPGTLTKVEWGENLVPESNFNGTYKPARDGYYLTFVLQDDDKFQDVRARVAESFHEKATLTKALAALCLPIPERGTIYDDEEWLGAQCLVTVESYESGGKTRLGVKGGGFTELPKAMKKIAAANVEAAFAYQRERDSFWAQYRAQQASAPATSTEWDEVEAEKEAVPF